MPEKIQAHHEEVIPERFQASRATLFMDRFMTHFIKVGGGIVIAAVLGIFIFILIQILPLFQGARVKELQTVQLQPGKYSVMGVDEWSQLPFLVRADGKICFADLSANGKIIEVDPAIATQAAPAAADVATQGESANSPSDAPKTAGTIVSAIAYRATQQELIFATSDGQFAIAPINYAMDYGSGQPKVTQKLQAGPLMALGKPGAAIHAIAFGATSDSKLIAGVQQIGDQTEIHAVRLARKRSLVGGGELKIDKSFDLTALSQGKPVQVLVNSAADSIIVLTAQGEVNYFFQNGDQFELRQTFKPFEELEDATVGSIDFLFGDVSLVLTSVSGKNRVYSLFRHPGSNVRTFGLTKELKALPGAATFYNSSLRNKAFLTGTASVASLRYSTNESIRWQRTVPFTIANGIISGKYDRLLFLDTDSKLHIYRLDDPHPDTSFQGLFGKEWYEGYSKPAFEWQSTGGTDEFEPKFSLVPLIIGTLKGTLYAMLFAVPIALVAALYTSQFLEPQFRAVIKPVMEIMASLPSVVLGFLAALWLAPLIEKRIPSIILLIAFVPLVALVFGYAWSSLPIRYRRFVHPGYEFVVFMPILLAVLYATWTLGPTLEKFLFVATDPASGQKVADFRIWWPQVTGASFEQRNSLVVGFMMGFAVIPIIFTIAEDALSNVPEALHSGSLALGASRWQTALRIVLPTASAGIFSALMIGLGRAVGETMIVVMATGNTPVMNFNIFSGMRTLSANIAVELPEAPVGGTLYRVLFLGAMLLFLMTFFVNTFAEILRQHLREKYKTI
jgi:phosphate transport system permease protein